MTELTWILASALTLLGTTSLAAATIPGQTVTDVIRVSSNLTCTGSSGKCFCSPTGPDPKQRYDLAVTLNVPIDTNGAGSGPYPLIIFIHGFGGVYILHTGDYLPYTDAATSNGFAFLEYDVTSGGGLMEIATDAIEVQFLPYLLAWARELNDTPDTPATGKLDVDHIAVAGHSRGGKIAALHFGSGKYPGIFAAYLVDPVDCPCFAPCTSNCYPSALAAIAAAGRPVGVSGAEVKGCCNPREADPCSYTCQAACYGASGNATCTGYDYQDFLYAAGGGSVGHTQAAGHMQFAVIEEQALQVLANAFCGCDRSVTNEVVSAQAAHNMVKYLQSTLSTLLSAGSVQRSQ